ncbi:hypothetical protein FHS27_001414 [Rhodopirellula rubra]|uniref:Uncharacterized protein n=1 Tax=Aporhodopirellula rubra TaxID=980271 RepID=A0A7W5DWB6_9BACT|nr:hypothetical protein [Aporhodopirellula rubra]
MPTSLRVGDSGIPPCFQRNLLVCANGPHNSRETLLLSATLAEGEKFPFLGQNTRENVVNAKRLAYYKRRQVR